MPDDMAYNNAHRAQTMQDGRCEAAALGHLRVDMEGIEVTVEAIERSLLWQRGLLLCRVGWAVGDRNRALQLARSHTHNHFFCIIRSQTRTLTSADGAVGPP